jgi:hypothetical protein
MTRLTIEESARSAKAQKWINSESQLVQQMQQGVTSEVIYQSASVFMVARQFPKRNADRRSEDFDRVVGPLKVAVEGLTSTNLVERVVKFAKKLSSIPGLLKERNGKAVIPISAASKFVWVAAPDRGVIYDRHARRGLVKLGHSVPERDYGAFVAAFRDEYQKQALKITSGLKFVDSQIASESSIGAKIFDLWLYSIGRSRN